MTDEPGSARRRVYLWSLVLGFGGIAALYAVSTLVDDVQPPVVVVGLILVGVTAFVVFVARDEYRAARSSGLTGLRAVGRSVRKTIDTFVMGK